MTATTKKIRWPAKAGEYPGCSDHGCVFGHPGGMGTNGGCDCLSSMRDPVDRVKVRAAIGLLLVAAAEPEAAAKDSDGCTCSYNESDEMTRHAPLCKLAGAW